MTIQSPLPMLSLPDAVVGNHEFDEGVAELVRMQYGGCHPVDGCHPTDGSQDGDGFAGAGFRHVAANATAAVRTPAVVTMS